MNTLSSYEAPKLASQHEDVNWITVLSEYSAGNGLAKAYMRSNFARSSTPPPV